MLARHLRLVDIRVGAAAIVDICLVIVRVPRAVVRRHAGVVVEPGGVALALGLRLRRQTLAVVGPPAVVRAGLELAMVPRVALIAQGVRVRVSVMVIVRVRVGVLVAQAVRVSVRVSVRVRVRVGVSVRVSVRVPT